jgi:putative hemolysin
LPYFRADLLNGLFAMSEIALVTARKARLQKLSTRATSAAMAAVKLGEDPTRFLSTIQIGITSIGVLNGIVGEAALAAPLALWLQTLGVPNPTAIRRHRPGGGAHHLLLHRGRRTGAQAHRPVHPETLARLVARPIDWLAIATKPFVLLLSVSTRAAQAAGREGVSGNAVTEEEIHAMLAEGTSAGVIESHEHTMVRNVFRLDDRQIGSLMVPRSDVVVLDLDDSFEVNMARSKLPTTRASRWSGD